MVIDMIERAMLRIASLVLATIDRYICAVVCLDAWTARLCGIVPDLEPPLPQHLQESDNAKHQND